MTQAKLRREVALKESSEEFTERRNAVLRSAAELFAEVGYEATSIGAIGDRAGINRASVYYYFGSKVDIVGALLQDVLSRLVQDLADIRACTETPASEKLHQAVGKLMASYAANYPYQYWYQRALADYNNPSDTAGNVELKSLAMSYVDDFVEIVRQGIETGEFKELGSPELMARGILGMVNATQGWYRPDSGLEPSEVSEVFARMVLEGLRS